jgi:hypothetical protein
MTKHKGNQAPDPATSTVTGECILESILARTPGAVLIDVPVAVAPHASEGGTLTRVLLQRETERFMRLFHERAAGGGRGESAVILRTVGGCLAYRFRGEEATELVHVLALPRRDVVVYTSATRPGRVAISGSGAEDFAGDLMRAAVAVCLPA